MQHIDLMNIKVNQIQIFLTAVDCGSFSGAAEALHVTQPMVSKTIQTLEKELGIILFIRSKGKLRLTPAGRECYNQWAHILKELEASIGYAHTVQEGSSKRLHIGAGSVGVSSSDFFDKVKEFKDKYSVNIIVECHPMTQLISGLMEEAYDAILVSRHLIDNIESKGLKSRTIRESNLAVFIPWDNPLSKSEKITFADLKKESFIVFSAETDPHYMELINSLSKEAGFKPKIACYIPDESSFEANLRLNNGIALIDSQVVLSENVARRYDLENMRNDLLLAWKETNASLSLQNLLDFLEKQG